MVLRNFCCSRRRLDVEPEADRRAHNRDRASGMQMREMLTPFERRAINSLSAESRPNTSRIAVNNPQGMVKMSENGRT